MWIIPRKNTPGRFFAGEKSWLGSEKEILGQVNQAKPKLGFTDAPGVVWGPLRTLSLPPAHYTRCPDGIPLWSPHLIFSFCAAKLLFTCKSSVHFYLPVLFLRRDFADFCDWVPRLSSPLFPQVPSVSLKSCGFIKRATALAIGSAVKTVSGQYRAAQGERKILWRQGESCLT